MRVLFPALLFVCFLFASCDKERISIRQSESFVKFYGDKMDDIGMQVIAAKDGSFIIMGNIATPNRGKDICFIHTDAYGNSIAPVKVYGSLFDDNGYAIRKTSKGYIIAGSTEQSNGGKKDILLVQVDEQGNELKSSIIGTNGNDEAFDIQVLSNGNYILTGYTDSIEARKKEMMLAQTNPDGDLLSMNLIGYKEDDEVGNSIIADDSTTYYIAGYTKSRPSGTTRSNVFIVRWNVKGTGLGTAIPLINESNGNSSAASIISDNSGNFIISCNIQPLQQTNSNIKLIKIDKDLNVIWQNDTYNDGQNDFVSNTYIFNNKIYIVGTSGTANEFGNILLVEIQKDGSNPVFYHAGDGSSYSGRSLDFTSDGGYIITGANKTNESSVITLIKLNSGYKL